MKKLGKVTKKKAKHLPAVVKLAKKEMVGALKRSHEERMRLLQNQIYEPIKASRKADRDLAIKIAKFRFKHSIKINTALFSNPKFLPCFFDQHFGVGPGDPFAGGPGDPFGGEPGNPFGDWKGNPKDNPRWDEFVITMRFLEKHFNIHPPISDPSLFVRPNILSCPTTLSIAGNLPYTITGGKFGASPGSIYITINDTGMRIDPAVLHWSDTAIMFRIPTSVGGVPFHAGGRLTVINTDGYHDSVWVTMEPVSHILSYDASYSESGEKYRTFPPGPDWWYTYEKEIPLVSPPFPQEYELFNAPSILTAPGLVLDIFTKTYVPEVESPASVSLVAGPYESGNSLRVDVKVTDDWYWDYRVNARFFIVVPQGYSSQGWYGG